MKETVVTRSAPRISSRGLEGGRSLGSFEAKFSSRSFANFKSIPSLAGTAEYRISSVPVTDRTVPGRLAFSHTKPVWETPKPVPTRPFFQLQPKEALMEQFGAKNKTRKLDQKTVEKRPSRSYSYLYIPEVKPEQAKHAEKSKEEEPKNIKSAVAAVADVKKVEIAADAIQAMRVAKAYEAVGLPAEQAVRKALIALNEKKETTAVTIKTAPVPSEHEVTQAMPDVVPQAEALPKTSVFPEVKRAQEVPMRRKVEKKVEDKKDTAVYERDKEADDYRKHEYLQAYGVLFWRKFGEPISGNDVVQLMPKKEPQLPHIQSELVKKDARRVQDGSYNELVDTIKTVEEIKSYKDAHRVIDETIKEIPAVRKNEDISSERVTDADVRRVLQGSVDALDQMQGTAVKPLA